MLHIRSLAPKEHKFQPMEPKGHVPNQKKVNERVKEKVIVCSKLNERSVLICIF